MKLVGKSSRTLTFLFAVNIFSLDLKRDPERPREYGISPLLSFFLPGFDQWYEGQYAAAGFYTGTAIFGLALANQAQENLVHNFQYDVDSEDNNARAVMLGLQIYQSSGGLSAYSSFRSSVRSRKAQGDFEFLKHEENAGDLLRAPFQFSEVLKPTTFVPLLGVLALSLTQKKSSAYPSLSGSDVFYSAAFSYNAGTHEEAVFRGWLMPAFHENFANRFWSNTLSATLFAAAHISEDLKYPVIQFALGWYFGYLVQRNEWTLQQAIFIHTWWDVIAFTAAYMNSGTRDSARLTLPLLHFVW